MDMERLVVTTAVINDHCTALPPWKSFLWKTENLDSEPSCKAAHAGVRMPLCKGKLPGIGSQKWPASGQKVDTEGLGVGVGSSLKTTRPFKEMDLSREGNADGLTLEQFPTAPRVRSGLNGGSVWTSSSKESGVGLNI